MKLKRWYALEYIEEGFCIPKWYLPLYRDYDRRATVCYPIWFWPFAAMLYLSRGVMWHIAHDILDTLNELNLMRRNYMKGKGVRGSWLK